MAHGEYDCVVVGGGVAGLYAAWKMFQKSKKPDDLKVLLLEKNETRLGGRLWSVEFGDRWVALGGGVPRSSDSSLRALAADLGLTIDFGAKNSRVWVWDPRTHRIADRKRQLREIADKLRREAATRRKELAVRPLTFLQFLDRVLTAEERENALAWWGYRDADNQDALATIDRYGLDDVVGDESYGSLGPKGYQTLVDALEQSLSSRPGFDAILGARATRVWKSQPDGNRLSIEWETTSTPGGKSFKSRKETVSFGSRKGTVFEATAKVVLWCTDVRGLRNLRLDSRVDDERMKALTSAIEGVPFSRLYARYETKEDALPELHGKGMVRMGGVLGNVYSDGKSDVAMASYVGGSESDRWSGLADNEADERPLLLRPGDPRFDRTVAYLESGLEEVLDSPNVQRPSELLLVHWPNGVHLWRADGSIPGGKLSDDRELRRRSRTFLDGRLRVAGEAVAAGHGWVEDALQSVDEILEP